MIMRVEFYRGDEGRLCGWIATPPHRRPFHGSTMAAGRFIPHDLMQFTVERELDIRDGFWGLLAHGGSFASVPGRRSTKEGLAIVREHYDGLLDTEDVVNGHYSAWMRKEFTPLTPVLDAMYGQWLGVHYDDRLVLEWPVRPLPERPRRRREATPALARH